MDCGSSLSNTKIRSHDLAPDLTRDLTADLLNFRNTDGCYLNTDGRITPLTVCSMFLYMMSLFLLFL